MKKSFTLIELLIVVAIIGILAGVGIPAYQNYIHETEQTYMLNKHKSIVAFLTNELTKCALKGSITLNSYSTMNPSCSALKTNPNYYSQHLATHLNNIGKWKKLNGNYGVGYRHNNCNIAVSYTTVNGVGSGASAYYRVCTNTHEGKLWSDIKMD